VSRPLSKLTPSASWDALPKRVERLNLNGAKNPFFHMPDRPVINYGSVTLESSPAEVAVLNEENLVTFAVPRNTALLTLEAWTSPRSLGGAYPDQAQLRIAFNPAPPMSVWHVWEADGTKGGTFDAWLYDEYTEPSRAIREPLQFSSVNLAVRILDPAVDYNVEIRSTAPHNASHILESVTFYGAT
jgi:hypothetical protein